MSTNESYKWIQEILDKQIEKERYEYNLLMEQERIQQEKQRQIIEQQKQKEKEQKTRSVFFDDNLNENTNLIENENSNEITKNNDSNNIGNLNEKTKDVEDKNLRNFKPKIQSSNTVKPMNITGFEQISQNIVSKSAKKMNFAKTIRNNKFKPTELNLIDDEMGNISNLSKLDELTESEDEDEDSLPAGVRSTPRNIGSEIDVDYKNKDLIKLKTEVIKPSQLEENHKKKIDNKLDSDDIIALAKQMEKDRSSE